MNIIVDNYILNIITDTFYVTISKKHIYAPYAVKNRLEEFINNKSLLEVIIYSDILLLKRNDSKEYFIVLLSKHTECHIKLPNDNCDDLLAKLLIFFN